MEVKKHDPSIPRRMFWSDELQNSIKCPLCQSHLENENHTYMIGIRDEDKIASFIVKNNGGFFCPICPTVVLSTEVFEKITVEGDTSDKLRDINVAGIVDTRDMTETEIHALREPNSSTPLVEFLPRPEKG